MITNSLSLVQIWIKKEWCDISTRVRNYTIWRQLKHFNEINFITVSTIGLFFHVNICMSKSGHSFALLLCYFFRFPLHKTSSLTATTYVKVLHPNNFIWACFRLRMNLFFSMGERKWRHCGTIAPRFIEIVDAKVAVDSFLR